MTKSWEQEHERILDEMRKVLGVYPHGEFGDFTSALAKCTATQKAEYDRLSKLNDEAWAKAEKQL